MAAFSQLGRPGGNGTGSVVAIRGLVRRLFGNCSRWVYRGRLPCSATSGRALLQLARDPFEPYKDRVGHKMQVKLQCQSERLQRFQLVVTITTCLLTRGRLRAEASCDFWSDNLENSRRADT